MKLPEMPPRVLFDFATKCNLRCSMCPVWGEEDSSKIESVEGVMPRESALKVIDELSHTKPMIQPCLYGEPLVAPHLEEYLSAAKSAGMSVSMNTNGLALTRDLAQFFVDIELDSCMFSIDAVSPGTLKKIRGIRKLSRIEEAVMLMMDVRGDRALPRIGVSFTIQKENEHELNDFLDRWVGVVDVVRTGLIFEDGKFTELKPPEKRKPCPVIYKTMPIHNDGTVTACCLDGMRVTNMGNVFKDGVKGVWKGEKFEAFRRLHEEERWDEIPFCASCNGWAQYEYDETVENGILIRKSPEFTYYNKVSMLENWSESNRGTHSVKLNLDNRPR